MGEFGKCLEFTSFWGSVCCIFNGIYEHYVIIYIPIPVLRLDTILFYVL